MSAGTAAGVPRRATGQAARWTAVAAIEVVIAIHVVLTPMHLAETFYIGVLFTVGNALLFGAVLLLAGVRHRPAGWLLGTAVCTGEFAGFVLSRTVGLPRGYHEEWAAAPEDWLGLLSLACELAFVLLAVSAYGRRRRAAGDPAADLPVHPVPVR